VSGPTHASAPLVVVQTYVHQVHAGEPPRYEVQLAPDHGDDANLLVLITDNPAIYQDALDAEGTEQRFIARWHWLSAGARYNRMLDALEPTS
jgi:hypothetical protein